MCEIVIIDIGGVGNLIKGKTPLNALTKAPTKPKSLTKLRRTSERQLMATVTGIVEVLDPIGMHARPAGQIVKLVKESGLEVVFHYDGAETKANSALRLMAMKVKTGEKITVAIEADDEAAANGIIAQIQDFLKG